MQFQRFIQKIELFIYVKTLLSCLIESYSHNPKKSILTSMYYFLFKIDDNCYTLGQKKDDNYINCEHITIHLLSICLDFELGKMIALNFKIKNELSLSYLEG